MKALSVRQPWAHFVVQGMKTVEIRTWGTDYRGRMLVHAGRAVDREASHRFQLGELALGALVGTVELVAVEPFTPATWMALATEHLAIGPFRPGLFAWMLEDPRPFRRPLPWAGKLGLFDVDTDLAALEPRAQGARG